MTQNKLYYIIVLVKDEGNGTLAKASKQQQKKFFTKTKINDTIVSRKLYIERGNCIMMKTKTITMYLCKSKRQNSKCICKTLDIVKTNHSTKLKTQFNKNDIMDFIDKIVCCKKDYSFVRFTVFDENFCLSNWNTRIIYGNIEQTINCIYKYMQYLNGKEFDFTLGDLHTDKNVKYYINKYYHD